MSRLGWVDAQAGASGDMLLGALADLGVSRGPEAAAALGLPARVAATPVRRAGLAAVQVTVAAQGPAPPRAWADVRELLTGAPLPEPVRALSLAVFARLAAAEGAVHGVDPQRVHFHEVGALDALIDVVGVCWGVADLALDRLVCSPVALGAGRVAGEHGALPVPAPAVVALLAAVSAPVHGGGDGELCTPTGAALLAELADGFGPVPALRLEAAGVGAGSRERADAANVLRLLVGEGVQPQPGDRGDAGEPAAQPAVLVEANVDDMDPRLWPGTLAALLAAGALDAWLTPVLAKKGRPAHVVAALTRPAELGGVRHVIFAHTSTIGLRETDVRKRPLPREQVRVAVDGQPVRVTLARLAGQVVTATPEWEDVAAAAAALGRPAKAVLAAAVAAAEAIPPDR